MPLCDHFQSGMGEECAKCHRNFNETPEQYIAWIEKQLEVNHRELQAINQRIALADKVRKLEKQLGQVKNLIRSAKVDEEASKNYCRDDDE